MLLTITSTHPPATDLGYLLHKHPARCQTFPLSFGKAYVFYPTATQAACTAALLVELDPVALVRRRGRERNHAPSLRQYVNDRPYVASSFLSVAINQVYSTALSGRCKERPDLAAMKIPLKAVISVLSDSSGGDLTRRIFEPLGYRVTSKGYPLDEKFEIWGTSPYFTVELSSTVRLSDLLRHLYVLLPVLDNQKHYWIGDAEVEKLLQKGKDWLKDHPERNLIVNRYLKYQAPLRYKALEKLMEEEGDDPDEKKILEDREEQKLEKKLSLNEQRMNSVIAVLKSQNVKSIIDLGCGEGRLIKNLRKYHEFKKITGMDISYQALTSAKKRLDLDRMPSTERARIQLIHGSLIYKDDRIKGFDAATCIEVIEHLDPFKLEMFEKILFGEARPETIIITTPNSEYNVKFNIPGRFRHRDHRFEWTREEFREWARPIAERYGYTVRFLPIGPEDPVVGAPTQMGVFSR